MHISSLAFFSLLFYNKHENVTAYQRRGIEITWCENVTAYQRRGIEITWCENVVSPHLPSEMGTWNFYEERGDIMDIIEGCFYHISDKFFLEVNEPSLMANKEDGTYRPHYLAIRDTLNTEIFWMIPVSSKYTKFAALYDKQIKKYGLCTKIVLGKCDGKDAAYLIQNAFPVTADFFDHIHISNGVPLTVHEGTGKTIVKNLKNNLRLQKKGINLFFSDIGRIYQLMVKHLEDKK